MKIILLATTLLIVCALDTKPEPEGLKSKLFEPFGSKKKNVIPTIKEEDNLQAKIDNYLQNLELKQAYEEQKRRAEMKAMGIEEPTFFSVFDDRPGAKLLSFVGLMWFVVYFMCYKGIFCTWRDYEMRKIQEEHEKKVAKKRAHEQLDKAQTMATEVLTLCQNAQTVADANRVRVMFKDLKELIADS